MCSEYSEADLLSRKRERGTEDEVLLLPEVLAVVLVLLAVDD